MKGFVEKLKSWKLDRDIKAGRKNRGRQPPRPPTVRERWLEFCLRLRTLRAAVLFLFFPPDRQPDGVHRGAIAPTGRLFARKVKLDGEGNVVEELEDLGLVSTKVVTTAGVGFIVDAFQNSVELETMKYHGSGTGVTAEAVGDTTLGTEVESRATGTTTEGASANIYQTVGTVSYTATRAITEHGIFSASSGGVLLDRSVFSAINVVNGDAIEFTYELTFPAGS